MGTIENSPLRPEEVAEYLFHREAASGRQPPPLLFPDLETAMAVTNFLAPKATYRRVLISATRKDNPFTGWFWTLDLETREWSGPTEVTQP